MKFKFTHQFALPPGDLFHFHENPENLALLMRNRHTFTLVSHEGSIRPSCVTTVAERFCAFRLKMAFEHYLYECPLRFGERQITGLFSKFEHVHEFTKNPDGGTTLTDLLEVRLPWWLGGEQAMKYIVAPRLREVFAYRRVELERLIADGTIERLLSDASY
ncbi:MAG: hypothetical protein ACR2IE_14860 [Candidatus Sumerlaeaceae bacterium]